MAGCGAPGVATTVSVQTLEVTPPPTDTPVPTPAPPTAPPSAVPTPSGPDVIDAATARAMVDRWNAARAQAYAANDIGPLRALESSPVLDTDTVVLTQRRIGAAARTAAPTVDQVTVAVPHQTGYPAVVYATQTATVGSTAVDEVLGFTSPAPGAPWTLAWRAATPDLRTGTPPLQTGADGAAILLDASAQQTLLMTNAAAAGRLAADLRPGAASDPGMVLVQALPDIARTARDTQASFAKAGGSASVQFAGMATPVAMQTTEGGASIVMVVTYTATLNPASGQRLTETSAHPYGQGLLLEGDYFQVVDTFTFMYAAQVPAKTAGASVTVYAVGGGLRGATGTPAPPTPRA